MSPYRSVNVYIVKMAISVSAWSSTCQNPQNGYIQCLPRANNTNLRTYQIWMLYQVLHNTKDYNLQSLHNFVSFNSSIISYISHIHIHIHTQITHIHACIYIYTYIYIYTHMRTLAQGAVTSGTDKQLPPAEYCEAQLPIHARSRDTRLRPQRPHLHTWLYILYILWILLACLCILFLWFLYRPYGHGHKRLNKNARRVVAPCRFGHMILTSLN